MPTPCCPFLCHVEMSPKLPPGDNILYSAGHNQNFIIFLVNFKDGFAVKMIFLKYCMENDF